VTTPKVSICIPVRNGGQLIGQAIDSVLAQTFDQFELVVVDNQSTDGTYDRVAAIVDPRIRLFRNDELLPPAENWNRAITLAQTPYVKVLHHDDLLYPDCIALQYAALTDPANVGVSLVCCSRDIIDPRGRVILRGRGFGRRVAGRINGREAIVRSGTNPIGEPVTAMFHRDLALRLGGFDGRNIFMLDLSLWCPLLREGDLFVIPKAACAFRTTPTSLSTTRARRQSQEAKAFFRTLAADPQLGITRMDLVVASVKVELLAAARRVVYAMS
jgi:glycosyltransferase involved in cell wall biosynthesis